MKKQFLNNKHITGAGYLLIAVACVYVLWLFYPIPKTSATRLAKYHNETTTTQKRDPKNIDDWQSVLSVKSKQKTDYSIPPTVNGLAPVIYSLPTKEKVVFLGIDDGAYRDDSVIEVMKKYKIKASLFLSKHYMASDPKFFSKLTKIGSVIENHTLNHSKLMATEMSYGQQKEEICGMSDYENKLDGGRPTLFRPPYGNYSESIQRAVAACGMRAVVIWNVEVNEGQIEYASSDKLRPGDIVLMHFRPEFADDMKVFAEALKESGLRTALLENAM